MKVKYPSTMYLPWSSDVNGIVDKGQILWNASEVFAGKEIVALEKMDGENSTLAKEYYHARSLDSGYHPSRDWIKRFWGSIRNEIPDTFRICGENLYAKHTIHYTDLLSYYYGFSLWENAKCFSWDETIEYFEILGIKHVPVLYRGIYDEKILKELMTDESSHKENKEGYVIRLTSEFQLDDFETSVAKWVRKNFVQTDSHWMHSEITNNRLKPYCHHGFN